MLTKKFMSFAAVALLIGSVSVQGAVAGQGKAHCSGKKHCSSKKECGGNHGTTCKAMGKAGMCGVIGKKGAVTIFAPTNAAWDKMPKANRDALMNDRKQLHKVMAYHVVPKKIASADLQSMRAAKTMEGEFVMINNKDGTILVDGAIVQGDPKNYKNATIYEIDEVLIPNRGK